ncbi:MAG TPA: PadR family transcriptional regulator [Micromonosporaceae bacterium]|jgi:DNA-binding PadR family transcriptional regulator
MRGRTNPLALAVLTLLFEQPMHPYEMSTTLRFRAKEESVKINWGSLYTVVDSLRRRGLIEAVDRSRAGRRPERTVYRLTAAGEQEMCDWLGDLLARPTRQFTDFEAALSLMPALPPQTVRSLLRERLEALTEDEQTYERMRLSSATFPRLFVIEDEYRAALRRAETAFVAALLDDLEAGSFDGLAAWRRLHELKAAGAGAEVVPMILKEFFPSTGT